MTTHLITIYTPFEQRRLFFRVAKYELHEGRIIFFDEKTNSLKNFPAEQAHIEEVTE